MDDTTAIKVNHIYKDFKLPREKQNSIKSFFTSLTKGKTSGYEVQHALKDISFEIKKGEFFGIVGRNGSGKSTLLKIIAEIYRPTKGDVRVKGRLVPFIELGVGFNPELTGRENVYLSGALSGFSTTEIDAMYDDIVKFAELEPFMDQKLKNYSSGMQVRLAFSVATRSKADILLIDEVLAVGDADFQRKCFNYFKKLKRDEKTVVFVTHDMNAVREYCDRALLIDKNKKIYEGDPSAVAAKYSQLFIEQDDEESKDSEQLLNRWGQGDVQFTEVKVRTDKETIHITAKAHAKAPIDSLMYGFHIANQQDVDLTALSNRMILKPDIQDIKTGDEMVWHWTVQNIFNDGVYYVTLTLVNSDNTVYDWFTHAGMFTVKRAQRSTTDILPPISVTSTKAESRE